MTTRGVDMTTLGVDMTTRGVDMTTPGVDMQNGKIAELSLETALEQFKTQLHFCKKEKERFKRRNSLDSTMFYNSKLQELKWQMLQLKQHHEATGEVLEMRSEALSVPVVSDNEKLQEDQLELDVSDVFYNPITESKKLYFLRYVICLPLQRTVLQEQKTEQFKTTDLEKAENKLLFHYPRADLKVCESLKRGYMTVELYAERKLKSPALIGAQRVSLEPFLDQSTLRGVLTFGSAGEWDISYALNIRRAQMQEERDNFKMVQKNWVCLVEDATISRRSSVATMNHGSPRHRKHVKNNRNHRRSHKIAEDKSEKLNPRTHSAEALTEDTTTSERIEDLPSDKTSGTASPDNQNKNTTNKIKKTLRKRMSVFF